MTKITRPVLYIGLEARVKLHKRATLLARASFKAYVDPILPLAIELRKAANGLPIDDASLFWLNLVLPETEPGHDSRYFPPALVNIDGKTRRVKGLLGSMPYTDFVDLIHSIPGLCSDPEWIAYTEACGLALEVFAQHNHISPDSADGVNVRFVYCLDNEPPA